MSTNDNGWVPDAAPDIEQIGVIGPTGMHTQRDLTRDRGATRLAKSDNPIVRNINRFCEATPPINVSMATFGGFLVGYRMAMLHPEEAEQLLHDILIVGKSGNTDTSILDKTVEVLRRGSDDDIDQL
jgi:hypothetical protein